jgi:hypothetical protein
MQNFASTNQPNGVLSGQLWFDTNTNLLKLYNGTGYKILAAISNQVSAPLSPGIGDLWWDTVNQQLNVYNGTGWVIIGPLGGQGQVVGEVITDTGATSHNVISFQISNVRYAILSKDQTFTPNVSIGGFSTINPGLNIASTAFVSNNKFWGQASDSAALNGVSGSSFMRSDQNTSTAGILSVTNNSGINIGTTGTGSFNVTSNELHIDNAQNNGIIRLRTKNSSGSVVDALDVLANADVQISGNLIILGNLDVTTSNEVSIISGTQSSTNTTTGAFQVVGGVGIGGQLNVGGALNTFTGNVTVGNLQAVSGNVYATAVNAGIIGNTNAVLTGTLSTASQTNITSIGTLTSLSVSGATGFTGGTVTFNPTSTYKVILGNVGNVQIAGGTNGQVLSTDGSSNLSWYTVPTPVAGGGTAGQFAIYTGPTNLAANSGVTYNGATMAVTGAITATGDITAFYSSDKNLKTNISNIPHALEKVKQINGVTYNWNDIAKSIDANKTDASEAGVIAQEIEEVLPQVVTHRDDGYLAVRYEKLVPLLIEAIKELSAEVEALKARGS